MSKGVEGKINVLYWPAEGTGFRGEWEEKDYTLWVWVPVNLYRNFTINESELDKELERIWKSRKSLFHFLQVGDYDGNFTYQLD